MLCIERRAGESLYIGDNVQVELLEIGRAFVKLAVRAPRELTILRSEVPDRGWTREDCDASPVAAGGRREMLIVRRRRGESLSIGSHIDVTVLGIRSSHAMLAVRASRCLPIRRSDPGRAAEIFSRFSEARR